MPIYITFLNIYSAVETKLRVGDLILGLVAGDLFFLVGAYYMSNETNPGCSGYIGEEMLPSYVGIISQTMK